jgi:hypothetical protein
MKKSICILAAAALFTACERRETVTTPAAPAAPGQENNTTIVNPTPAGGTHTETHRDTTVVTPGGDAGTGTGTGTDTGTGTGTDADTAASPAPTP